MQLLTQRSPLYICISILLNKEVFLSESGHRFVVRSIAITDIILIYSITLLVCNTLILFTPIFSHESSLEYCSVWMLINHSKSNNLYLNNYFLLVKKNWQTILFIWFSKKRDTSLAGHATQGWWHLLVTWPPLLTNELDTWFRGAKNIKGQSITRLKADLFYHI